MAQKKNRALPGPRKNKQVEKNTPMKKAARVLTSLGRGIKEVSKEAAHVGREVAAAGGRAWSDYSDWARAQNIRAAEHNLAMTELRMKKRNLLNEMPEMVSGEEGGPGWDGADGRGRFPLPDRRIPDRRFVPATPVGYPSFREPTEQSGAQPGQTITVNVGTQPGARSLPPREESIRIPLSGEVPMEMAAEPSFEQPSPGPRFEEQMPSYEYQRPRPMIRRGPITRYHPLDRTGILGSTGILQTRGFLGQTGALSSSRAGGTGRILMSTGMLRATGAWRRNYSPPKALGVESLGILPEPGRAEQPAQQSMPKRRPGQVPGRGRR